MANSRATSQPVQFRGADNLAVLGLYYPAAQTPAPALLLLNDKYGWTPWAIRWNALGYNVYAIDVRNIMSGDPVETARKSIQDILLVMQQISDSQQVTHHQIAVLGGSFFGAQALVACAKSFECQTAILLSATDYKDDLDDPIATLGIRPLFIAVSRGEGSITATDQDYAQRAQGPHQIVVYDGSVHANGLLATQPELVDKIGGWLLHYLPLNSQPTDTF